MAVVGEILDLKKGNHKIQVSQVPNLPVLTGKIVRND